MTAPMRERKRERTRARIIRAAVTVLTERGYDATTLDQIADEVDIHKRTVQRYFPTKLHLVLHAEYAALDVFQQALTGRGGDERVLDIYRAHVGAVRGAMIGRPDRVNVERIAREEPAVHAARVAVRETYAQLLSAALSEEAGRSPDEDTDAMLAAWALAGGVDMVIRGREAHGRYSDLEPAAHAAIERVERAFLKDRVKA